MTRSICSLTGLATGGAGAALIGAITQESVLAWLGVASAIAAAGVSWILSQRAKIRDETRKQEWADFVLDWRREQVRAGKLDPLADAPHTMPASDLARTHSEGS